MDFAVRTDHMKENEKLSKSLDLTRKLKTLRNMNMNIDHNWSPQNNTEKTIEENAQTHCWDESWRIGVTCCHSDFIETPQY